MLSEQEIIRRESLQKLREYGIDPYPASEYSRSHYSSDILDNFIEGEKVIIAGRLLRRKIQGKASFGVIQDAKGKIQVYFNRDTICPDEDKSIYNDVFKKWLDLGDFIGIEGEVFKTRVGEITIDVHQFHLLSKSLKPLPLPKTDKDGNVYDAFNDPELRYRRRYVDLVVNNHVKETFVKRSKIMSSMRNFLNNHGLLNLYDRPQWYSVLGGSSTYIEKLLDLKIFDVKLNSKVKINRSDNKIFISNKEESEEYDLLIMANHPNQIEECIEDLSEKEKQATDSIKYQQNLTILHGDESLMPNDKNQWCSWNVYKDENYEYVTYWMNNLQKINTNKNIFVTLGDFPEPNLIFNEMQYEHPVLDFKALEGQKAFEKIQSEKNTYYTGAYLGYGFHEDGIKSSQAICELINSRDI